MLAPGGWRGVPAPRPAARQGCWHTAGAGVRTGLSSVPSVGVYLARARTAECCGSSPAENPGNAPPNVTLRRLTGSARVCVVLSSKPREFVLPGAN